MKLIRAADIRLGYQRHVWTDRFGDFSKVFLHSEGARPSLLGDPHVKRPGARAGARGACKVQVTAGVREPAEAPKPSPSRWSRRRAAPADVKWAIRQR